MIRGGGEAPKEGAAFLDYPCPWGFRVREFPDVAQMGRKSWLRYYHTFGDQDSQEYYEAEAKKEIDLVESYDLSKVDAEMQSLIKAVERMRLFQRSSWVEIPERPLLAWDAQTLQSGGAWALTKTRADRQTAKRKVEVLVQTDTNLSQTESEHICAVLRAASHFVNVSMTLQNTHAMKFRGRLEGGFALASRGGSDPWIIRLAASRNRDHMFHELFMWASGMERCARRVLVGTVDHPIVPGSYVWIPCNISLDTQQKRIELLKTIVTGQTKRYPGVDHLMIDPSEL